jgi:potassium efflux system protein
MLTINRTPRLANLVLLAGLFTSLSSSGLLAEQAATPAAHDSAADQVLKKREAVAARIAQLTAEHDKKKAEQKAADATKSEDDTADETLSLLRSLDGIYTQQLTVLAQRRQLTDQIKQGENELESLDKFALDEPKPYSFLLLDNLKDQLSLEAERQDAAQADLKSSKQLLEGAHTRLDDGKQDSATVRPGGSGDELAAAALPLTIERANVALRQFEVEVQTLRVDFSKAHQKLLAKKIEIVKKDVKFTPQDRETKLDQIATTETELRRLRKEAETHFQQLESDKKPALDKLGDEKAKPGLIDAAGAAWRVAADVYQAEVAVLDQRIENLAGARRAWKRRYDLIAASVPERKASEWLEDLDEFKSQLSDTTRSLEHRRDAMRNEQAAARRGEAAEGTEKWVDFAQARRQELRDLCETSLEDVKSLKRMLGRFHDELKSKVKPEQPTGLVGWVKSLFGEKIEVADEESISVGKLLALVSYIFLGVIVAYLTSRLFNHHLLGRIGLHRGTIAALRSITFYCLCIVFAVLAFQVLHIPVAAFAFLGGAAAIAVGFGSQDIMNNFMSGIILLAEQPIRVGDVVQLSGVQGTVLHIGLRSTRLQTDSNHELIVPNKTLIDEQVTNLTLSDNFVQLFVPVVTERNIDVQKAKWDMMHVAFSHPLVMKSPRPLVLLKEVETYWLTFEVHFWLEHGSFIRCALAQSEILEQISDLFKPPPEAAPETEKAPADDGDANADSISMQDVQKMSRAAITKQARRLGLKL